MYAKGIGTTQDYEQAKYWFEKAAHSDNAEAQFNLGIVYYEGEGTAQASATLPAGTTRVSFPFGV